MFKKKQSQYNELGKLLFETSDYGSPPFESALQVVAFAKANDKSNENVKTADPSLLLQCIQAAASNDKETDTTSGKKLFAYCTIYSALEHAVSEGKIAKKARITEIILETAAKILLDPEDELQETSSSKTNNSPPDYISHGMGVYFGKRQCPIPPTHRLRSLRKNSGIAFRSGSLIKLTHR